MRTTRTFWTLLIVVLLAAGVGATVLRKPASVAPASSNASPPSMVLLPGDVCDVQRRDLRQVLPLSGTLRAVEQAMVKARVSGEVRAILVREGEAVRAGQILVQMDTTEYAARQAQAAGVLVAARGQREIATKARDNSRALLGKGFISQNAYDNAASQYDIAQANVDSAQAALDVTRKAVADTTIRAPIAGLVSRRSVEPGEKVTPDFPLLEIVNLRHMEMEATVPTNDIQRIALGQEVQLRVDGVTLPVAGKVARINPSTQSGSRSIIVYVAFDNPQGVLRAGMFGDAQLTLVRRNAVLTVPTSAIQTINQRTLVYSIEGGLVQRVPVSLGITGVDGEGSAVEVVSGLRDGARIVRNNLGTFLPGTAVTFTTAAPVPAPGTVSAAAAPLSPAH